MSEMKRVLLAVVLCVIAIVAIEAIFPAPKAPPGPITPPVETRIDAPDGPPAGQAPVVPAPAPDGDAAPAVPPPAPVEVPAFEPFPLRSGRLRTTVIPRGGALGAIVLEGVLAEPAGDPAKEENWLRFGQEPLAGAPGHLAVSVRSRDIVLGDVESRDWTLVSEPGAMPVVLETRILPVGGDPARGGLVLRKTYEAAPSEKAWHLRMRVEIRNEDQDLTGKELRLVVRGPARLADPADNIRDLLQGWTSVVARSLRLTTGAAVEAGLKNKEPVRDEGEILWTGAGSTYFAAALRPLPADSAARPPRAEVEWTAIRTPDDPKAGPRPSQASPVLVLPGRVPVVGQTDARTFEFFTGPKSDEVLESETYSVYAPVRVHGFFALIEEALFLLLNAFHAVVPNWGVAIILLTLVVRAALHPLSRKQLKSTIEYGEKMKKFKPKLDELKKKYEKNKQKLQQEQMRLMKEEGIPLMPGGCLLTFLQIPIWFALYGMLQTHFAMRHATFLWIDDLSRDDRLWALPSALADIWMVPDHLNLLPLLMTASWFFASKATMTPPTDEQQAQMQKMMQWMPFIMLLFPGFYTMPAGLCLYITISSSWGIAESHFIRRSMGVK